MDLHTHTYTTKNNKKNKKKREREKNSPVTALLSFFFTALELTLPLSRIQLGDPTAALFIDMKAQISSRNEKKAPKLDLHSNKLDSN